MQARLEARLAQAAFAEQPAAGAADTAQLVVPVPGRQAVQTLVGGAAGAYLRLGEALMAVPAHPDRDAAGAAQVRRRAAVQCEHCLCVLSTDGPCQIRRPVDGMQILKYKV